ncbi:hypothetical protein SNEBB_001392 [Seison nebaliae]|nr:hypothetical protein SNEBB_001392 [Seison nebaliae]
MGLRKIGGVVSMATSNDDVHRPDHVIDGNPSSYWVSSGFVPQFIVITFPQLLHFNEIILVSYGINKLLISISTDTTSTDFKKVKAVDISRVDPRGGFKPTKITFSKKMEAKHVRFQVDSAHDKFFAIKDIDIAQK